MKKKKEKRNINRGAKIEEQKIEKEIEKNKQARYFY